MDPQKLNELINRYETVSFSVNKKAEVLIKEEISEDLTNDQHAMLRYIKTIGTCTSSELADIFYVNKSAITAIINRLVEKGLITRTRDEKDRRNVYLSLTDKGDALFALCEEKIHKLVASFITQFDESEISNFIQTYEKLANILDVIMKHSSEGEEI